jgi:hypothetical protein
MECIESCDHHPVTSRFPVAVAGLVLGLGVYLALGLGHHRLSVACYESRHSLDQEPMAEAVPSG